MQGTDSANFVKIEDSHAAIALAKSPKVASTARCIPESQRDLPTEPSIEAWAVTIIGTESTAKRDEFPATVYG